MSIPQPVPKWDVAQVGGFLEGIGLAHLAAAFKENAVNGSDLISLNDDDFVTSLGCTPLQTKKIRRELEAYGIHGPDAAPAPAPAPAAAAVPAPVAEASPQVAAPVAAPDAGKANMDRVAALHQEVAELEQRANAVRGHSQTYAQGQQALRLAEAELKQAAGSLRITQFSGATETIQDARIGLHGGGPLGRNRREGRMLDHRNDFGHNAVEMATINRANAMMKQGAQHIQQAQRVLPNLPFIQSANVQQAMGGVFFNAFFAHGLIGDMVQSQKVHKAKAAVDQMHNEVVQALDWCANNMNAANAEAANLAGMAASKQGELAAAMR